MTISVQFVKMPNSETLTAITEDKLRKLAEKYNWLIHAETYYKLENDAVGKKICEIELSLPGPKIFAVSKEDNFEMALKKTLKDVNRQLRKRKEKAYNH